MVSRGEDKYVIWPIYFDKSYSRSQGRKTSKKHSKEKPSIEDIAKIAKSLKLNPILEKDQSHPSRHWKQEGRILVDKKGSKSEIINQISKML